MAVVALGHGPVKIDFHWSYRASKDLGAFLLIGFLSRMSTYVFEINEDKTNKIFFFSEFYAMFFQVIFKKKS